MEAGILGSPILATLRQVDVLILALVTASAGFRIALHYHPEGTLTDIRALDLGDWLNQMYGVDGGQLRPGQIVAEQYDGLVRSPGFWTPLVERNTCRDA